MDSSLSDPKAVKKLEKQLAKDASAREKELKHVMKALAVAEKDGAKAKKDMEKAVKTLSKKDKKQMEAEKAANEATHKMEIATADKTVAEKDAKLKQERELKMQQEIDAKKAMVDEAMKQKLGTAQIRESKLAEVHTAEADIHATHADMLAQDGRRPSGSTSGSASGLDTASSRSGSIVRANTDASALPADHVPLPLRASAA